MKVAVQRKSRWGSGPFHKMRPDDSADLTVCGVYIGMRSWEWFRSQRDVMQKDDKLCKKCFKEA